VAESTRPSNIAPSRASSALVFGPGRLTEHDSASSTFAPLPPIRNPHSDVHAAIRIPPVGEPEPAATPLHFHSPQRSASIRPVATAASITLHAAWKQPRYACSGSVNRTGASTQMWNSTLRCSCTVWDCQLNCSTNLRRRTRRRLGRTLPRSTSSRTPDPSAVRIHRAGGPPL
jgi:hypothetical protein